MIRKIKKALYSAALKPANVSIGLLLLLILQLNTSCQEVRGTKEIKLAHSLDITHPVHKAMVFMAERVAEKSDGKLSIDIYAGGQLGSEREALELLQIGSIGMTKVSAATMESFSPAFKVLSLPYIFEDKAHSHKVLGGEIGEDFLQEGEQYWLKGLAFYDAGSRSFYTTSRPIETPEDLKGLKIRVMESNTAINMVQAFGGSATPISWGELYTSLQQNVVDGAENNPPSFYLSRHYEVAKYYSLNEHTMIPDILMISTKVWNELTEQEKQWMREAVAESIPLQQKLWQEAEEEALEAVKEAGVQINYPDKEPFAELVEPMYEQFKDQPELYDYIQRIQDAANNPADSIRQL